jgi:hypothetical protein
MIQTGYELAKNMNWDVVVKNYLLGSLQFVSAKAEAVAGSGLCEKSLP